MPIDSSIALGVKPMQIESPLNMMAQVMQIKGAQNQNDLAQYSLSKAQRTDADMNALMQHLSSGGDLSTPEGRAAAFKVAPLSAPGMIETQLKQKLTEAQTQDAAAKATKALGEAGHQRISQYRDQSQNITDPQGAAALVTAMHSDPLLKDSAISRVPLAQWLAEIPQDAAQIPAWKQQFALGATKFTELNKPNVQVRNTGGSTDVLTIPGMGGAAQVVSSVKNTQSPDAQLQASTSRANNAANIAKDLQVAGIGQGGTMDENSERTAQAIASGQLPAPTGIALLNPKNQRLLGRVMEINPQYDATTVTAKKAAATAFTSGPLGNALRSVSTANAHLDQLGELADAMNNGNMQVVNKVQNYFATQTGSPNVTNFDAIKNIVGQEVVKAIVAGGGSMAERDEAAKIFSSASSPAQLKGAIQHYRMV